MIRTNKELYRIIETHLQSVIIHLVSFATTAILLLEKNNPNKTASGLV